MITLLRSKALRPWIAVLLGLAATHNAYADFINPSVKRGLLVGARAEESAPNCSPCGQDQEAWIVKGVNNRKELWGYDSLSEGSDSRDLNAGNQTLSFEADYRGMHAQASSSRKVDFLSPDVISVNVVGSSAVTHPGGAALLRDAGVASAFGDASTEFVFSVDRPTTVEVKVGMAFKDAADSGGAQSNGGSGLFTFVGGGLDLKYTQADLAKGPLSFTATLLPGSVSGVSLEAGGLSYAASARRASVEWQADVTIRAVPEPSGMALALAVAGGALMVRRAALGRRLQVLPLTPSA